MAFSNVTRWLARNRLWTPTFSALLAAVLTGVSAPTPVAANSVSDLSDVAQEAFADLTTCLTSGQDKVIDVFYLVDDSDSLLNTDPATVREEILSDSILQLANFADQGIEVNVGAALFSTQVTPIFPWRGIATPDEARASAEDLSRAIINSASRGSGVKWTNWEAGLRYANSQLQAQNSSGLNCQALIWFTDGGIRLGDDKSLSLPSLASLCHSEISGTNLARSSDTTLGLMAELKERNVGVFAVLYNNEEALRSEAASRGATPEEVEERVGDFRYFASFLLPLVEGSGEIYGDYTPEGFPSGGYLECADLGPTGLALAGQSNGAFLDAEDPISLAFQFLKLQAQISGGDSKEIGDGGSFEVRPGTAAIKILTTSTDWSLTDPDGKVRANPDSAPPIVDISDRSGVTTISLQIREDTDLGPWLFEPREEESISSLFVYAGLTLALDRDRETPIVVGRDNTLAGAVVRQPQFSDLALDLSVYEDSSLSLEIIDGGKLVSVADVTTINPDPNSGSFRIDRFNPEFSSGDEIQVQLTLTLGGDFQPVKSRFTLTALASGAFPLLADSVIVLTALDGPEGVAEGVMRVNPPTDVPEGEFCIAQSAKRVSDPQETAVEVVDRAREWDWQFSAATGATSRGDLTCFVVPQSAEPFLVSVSARNPLQADSRVESVHAVASGVADGQSLFTEDVVFEFESTTQQNTAIFLTVFVALLLLGILLPLALLYFFNRFASRFAWASQLLRAEFPVSVSLGSVASFTDSRTQSPVSVGPQDFQFLTERKNPRSVEDEPRGLLVCRVPLFPLSASWSEWLAQMGYRVVSIYPGAQKNPARFADGKATEISPVMAENWALVFSETDLLSAPPAGPIPGTLVVYSEMKNLSQYQTRLVSLGAQIGLVERIQQVYTLVCQENPDSAAAQELERNSSVVPAIDKRLPHADVEAVGLGGAGVSAGAETLSGSSPEGGGQSKSISLPGLDGPPA